MTQETMGLYKRTGTNPFSSCLPLLLQSPIFFALYRVLANMPAIAADTKPSIGPLTPGIAAQANASTIFGAPLSATFQHTLTIVHGAAVSAPSAINVKIICVVMIVLMAGSQFTSMRQLMMKNMPASALDNPAAKMQKNMMYLMPLMFIFTGVTFAIGLLLYWLTTNIWTMGQQFYTIRRMPAPGSLAEKALEERRLKSGKQHQKFSIPGLAPADQAEDTQDTPVIESKPQSGQRQQPKRKKRVKSTGQGDTKPRTTPPGATPPGATPAATPPGAKPPGAKPPGAKPPGAKPAGASSNSFGGDVA